MYLFSSLESHGFLIAFVGDVHDVNLLWKCI